MSKKCNYNLFQGEPVGNRDCDYHHNERCTLISNGTYLTPCIPSSNSACIPGIRIQRDHFRSVLEGILEMKKLVLTENELSGLISALIMVRTCPRKSEWRDERKTGCKFEPCHECWRDELEKRCEK